MQTTIETLPTKKSTIVVEPGNGTLEIFDFPTDSDTLLAALTDMFKDHWDSILLGPLYRAEFLNVAHPMRQKKLACWMVI